MRVLVVEDDRKIASFVVKGLKQAGFAVDYAADGEDGLHQSTTQPYDVAVIDIMLPKLDGLHLVERIRQQHINTRARLASVLFSRSTCRWLLVASVDCRATFQNCNLPERPE